MHQPVLLKESIKYLNPKNKEVIVDGTLGEGGHLKEILNQISEGRILAIDLDKEVLENTKNLVEKNKPEKVKIFFHWGNYKDIDLILEKYQLKKIDGLILDLGFCLWHIKESKKGFSFLKDEVLDMRYSKSQDLAAYEVVNTFSENLLAEIFKVYGEEKEARKIAKAIVRERKKEKILTTFQLKNIIEKTKTERKKRISPATKVFQALRIYVNKELDNLETLLKKVPQISNKGARIVIISFHSLEDRLVKKYFKHYFKNKIAELLTKKPVRPTREEIKINPASRSAKLRAIKIK